MSYATEMYQGDIERLEERVKELEAERDRVMRENGKLNCHIDDLEAEIERLRSIADNNAANGLAAEERIVELENKLVTKVRHCDVTNRIAQLEAERDRLREELEHHWGSSDCSCERWEES